MKTRFTASALFQLALINLCHYADIVNGGFTVIPTCPIVKCPVVYVMK